MSVSIYLSIIADAFMRAMPWSLSGGYLFIAAVMFSELYCMSCVYIGVTLGNYIGWLFVWGLGSFLRHFGVENETYELPPIGRIIVSILCMLIVPWFGFVGSVILIGMAYFRFIVCTYFHLVLLLFSCLAFYLVSASKVVLVN